MTKFVGIEVYAPVHSITEVTVDDEADLRALFARLSGIPSAAAAFGSRPQSGDAAEVILGVSAGTYQVTHQRDDDFYQLVGAEGAAGEVELDVGGQLTEMPRRWLLSESAAFAAVREYVVGGAFPEGLVWEQ